MSEGVECGRKTCRCVRDSEINDKISCSGSAGEAEPLERFSRMISCKRRMENLLERSKRVTAEPLPAIGFLSYSCGRRDIETKS